MTKNTPGPWEIRHEHNVFAGRRLVANVGGYSSNVDSFAEHEENVANARLIAAAPELLELCRQVIEIIETEMYTADFEQRLNHFVQDARAAIARATGES